MPKRKSKISSRIFWHKLTIKFMFKIKNMHFKQCIFFIYNLFNQDICMYKNTLANDEYYAPKIRLNTGLFLEFYPFSKDNRGRKKERV